MPIIDLRDHIVHSGGIWQDAVLLAQQTPFTFSLADTRDASRLLLRWSGDSVTLAGPLRIRITFQTENVTYAIGAHPAPQGENSPGDPTGALLGAATLQANTVYSYSLDIPAGQVWPFAYGARGSAAEMGANFYDRVLIEVAGFETIKTPVSVDDLPCDLAVVDHPEAAKFFPVACEPCAPDARFRMPAINPALSVDVAAGGCVRTRFFNGMFITKEDLETEQRYFRIKNRLHNRAIGQGVVWGLNVGRQADKICVLPGYGIDCCGNDLTVTTVYKVDVAALLRDPAAAEACAASTRTAKRMHLLLEYVECPTEPRPVHDDPCGPTHQVCEPSRFRETVRLRLVPPRDPDSSGPLRDFLLAAQSLHVKYGHQLQTPTDLTPTSEVALRIDVDGQRFEIGPDGSSGLFQGSNPTLGAVTNAGVFTGGMLRIISSSGNVIGEIPLALLSLPGARGLEVALDRESSYRVELADWRVEPPYASAPGWADTGAASYALTWQSQLPTGGGAWQIKGEAISPPVRTIPVRTPACGDPCSPSEPARREPGPCDPPALKASSIPWPWLHADPLDETFAGDPKAVILGLLGAWLQHSVASSHEPEVTEPWSFQRLAATTIYRSAWLLFYGVDAADERRDVGATLEALLRGWCGTALYPGPVCPCEPHGVVIGCTTLQAGTLGEIDPFGGRRHVVQYPLLSYWGSRLLGLAPPDATVSRLFSLLCCVAALPRPTTSPRAPVFLFRLAEVRSEDSAEGDADPRRTATVHLAFGTEAALSEAYLAETGIELRLAESRVVGSVAFAGYVIGALRGDLPPARVPTGEEPTIEGYSLGGPFEAGVFSLLITRGLRPRDDDH